LERFTARHGISLTVQYGSDRLPCHALIEPPQPLLFRQEHVPLMSSEAVTEILEEVVPESVQGKQIAKSINPSSLEQDIRTAITLKRDTCPKLSN
jgi:hypothetical protein